MTAAPACDALGIYTVGLGGVWQCYYHVACGTLTSVGPNIHATSDGVCSHAHTA